MDARAEMKQQAKQQNDPWNSGATTWPNGFNKPQTETERTSERPRDCEKWTHGFYVELANKMSKNVYRVGICFHEFRFMCMHDAKVVLSHLTIIINIMGSNNWMLLFYSFRFKIERKKNQSQRERWDEETKKVLAHTHTKGIFGVHDIIMAQWIVSMRAHGFAAERWARMTSSIVYFYKWWCFIFTFQSFSILLIGLRFTDLLCVSAGASTHAHKWLQLAATTTTTAVAATAAAAASTEWNKKKLRLFSW